MIAQQKGSHFRLPFLLEKVTENGYLSVVHTLPFCTKPGHGAPRGTVASRKKGSTFSERKGNRNHLPFRCPAFTFSDMASRKGKRKGSIFLERKGNRKALPFRCPAFTFRTVESCSFPGKGRRKAVAFQKKVREKL